MTTRPFNVDPTLTAISIAYRNPALHLIGTRVLPPLQVMQETFKYSTFPIAEAFSVPNTAVGRRSRPPVLEFTGDEATAAVADYGIDSDIPYTDIDAASAARTAGLSTFDPETLASAQLTNLIQLDREVRVAAVVQNAANYSAGRKVTLAGNDQFSAFATSDPYGVIDNGIQSTLVYQPNTHAMGKVVWNKLKRHPKLIKAVKGALTEDGAISRRQYCDLFEIEEDRLLIGEGLINTAKKGQAVSLAGVWGKNIALLYIDPSKGTADDPTITWGFTAEFGQRIAGTGEDPHIGVRGGKFIRVGERVKELVVAPDVGYLVTDAVA
ncbi:MAG TPA: capsid protein [Devosia sp.]|jgi:hypothetical protein|nr:capsid protein [Devosia sp.]